jgi:hypothetical protein
MQTQIVDDIRKKYDPIWNRRSLWDRGYSEAFRPNVPAMLLELLSHQNFLDMQFFQDPRFRFDVSRAIYKAILKFVKTQNREKYIIQPLPVNNFSVEFSDINAVYLQWKPQIDILENSAQAEGYIIYTRQENNGFDNGQLISEPYLVIRNIEPGVIYSFKVTAVNEGGESFPSEVLSVCRNQNQDEPVLIINAFDRIAAPAVVKTESFSGFTNFSDAGVFDKAGLDFTGTQFNFNPKSPWKDDDAPGFGSSYADMESRIIPGNTFDFTLVHGQILKKMGRSFISTSDEAVMNGAVNLSVYKYIDLILGEEKKTLLPKDSTHIQFKTLPDSMQKKLSEFCQSAGNLFISGAYIGTDLFNIEPVDTNDVNFARNTLKYFWRTNFASKGGTVRSTDSLFISFIPQFEFNTGFQSEIYSVEAPDAIEPADRYAKVIMRYAEDNISAAVAYQGDYKVVVFGFPFECIRGEEAKLKVMSAIFKFFETKIP